MRTCSAYPCSHAATSHSRVTATPAHLALAHIRTSSAHHPHTSAHPHRFRGTVNPQNTCYRLGYGVGLNDNTVQPVLAATAGILGTMKSNLNTDPSLKWQ